MIQAKFSTDKHSGSITMTMTGHAGAAEPGEDLVCAGASMLTYTLAQAMNYMYAEDKLQKRPNIRLDKGRCWITAKPRPEHYAEALHTYFIAQVGMHLLSKNYPRNVSLISFDTSKEDQINTVSPTNGQEE